jgi:hypothetical protein
MSDWTIWATFLALGTGVALVATYLLCRARIELAHNRILVLEREMAMARLREEANEKKLSKIFEAVTALRESTEDHLNKLIERLDELRADDYAQQTVDAA